MNDVQEHLNLGSQRFLARSRSAFIVPRSSFGSKGAYRTRQRRVKTRKAINDNR